MSARPQQLLSFQHYPAGPSVSWENRFDGKACDLQRKSNLHTHITHAARFETIQDCAQMHRYTCDTLPPEPARSRKHTQMV